MGFAISQPICTSCRQLNYDQDFFYVQSFPPSSEVCCICGTMQHGISYMRLDPLKIPYPKVRRTTPRRRKGNDPKPHR